MTFPIWLLLSFLSGSLPFSYWLGRLFLDRDIRQFGDTNPGATNVFRAGGRFLGIAAFLLDTLKGVIPVGLANFVIGFKGAELVLVSLAPVLGHAISPFLRFRGGKAVAVTFGIWIGLTIWEAPTILGIMLLYWFRSVRVSGWALMFALMSLFAYFVLTQKDTILLTVLLLNALILAWKHRGDLVQLPGIRFGWGTEK